MEFVRSLRQLWRHRYFRRLLAVRVATQSCDGVLQIALASYVLFSPERQPDAASIAAVLAITLLPFSVLGPFVGVVLDRWSRRQILVVVDLSRSVLALALAALVATGLRTSGIETIFYGSVLLAMSLNRFLLAALSASLPHTIDAEEYMVANAVVPTVGPAGVLIGAGVGTTLRLVLGRVMPDYSANAILFVVAAAGLRAQREPRPADPAPPARARRGRSRPGPATSSPGWSRRWPTCASARAGRDRPADHRRPPDHLRHRHGGDDPGLPELLPHPATRSRRRSPISVCWWRSPARASSSPPW